MLKNLMIAIGVFCAASFALVVGVRSMRGSASAPAVVHGRVMRVRNLFTEMYGARVAGKTVLFDAGIDTDGKALDVLLGALGSTRAEVADVFLTHGHFDHVAASPLCRNATISIGEGDVELLAKRGPAKFVPRIFGMALPVPPIDAGRVLSGTTTTTLADGSIVLGLPLPGHTAGSRIFLFDGVLFVGDSMQIDGDQLAFAMPASSDDMDANRRGIASLGAALAGQTIDSVCTGHQGCTPAGQGRVLLDALIARAGRPARRVCPAE